MRGSRISFVWIVFTISACETWPQSFFSNRSFHKWDFQSQLNVYEYDNTYLYYIQLPLQRRNWHWLCKQHHFMIPLNSMIVGNGGVIEFNQIIWCSIQHGTIHKSTDLYHSTITFSLCPVERNLRKFPEFAKSSFSSKWWIYLLLQTKTDPRTFSISRWNILQEISQWEWNCLKYCLFTFWLKMDFLTSWVQDIKIV